MAMLQAELLPCSYLACQVIQAAQSSQMSWKSADLLRSWAVAPWVKVVFQVELLDLDLIAAQLAMVQNTRYLPLTRTGEMLDVDPLLLFLASCLTLQGFN